MTLLWCGCPVTVVGWLPSHCCGVVSRPPHLSDMKWVTYKLVRLTDTCRSGDRPQLEAIH